MQKVLVSVRIRVRAHLRSVRERLSLLGAPRAGSLEPRPDPGYTVIRGAIQILGVRNSGQQASRIRDVDALHFLHIYFVSIPIKLKMNNNESIFNLNG